MGFTEIFVLLQWAYAPDFSYKYFCQNLYFQPNAVEQMQYFHCDIQKTSETIFKVKKG